jgi:hypothetical protein
MLNEVMLNEVMLNLFQHQHQHLPSTTLPQKQNRFLFPSKPVIYLGDSSSLWSSE